MSQQASSRSNERVKAQYDEYLMTIWKSLNVPIKRASGCVIEDFDGNEYLDVFSGISLTNTGHTNEAVVEAAEEQLGEFIHGCSYVHPNQPVADLAMAVGKHLKHAGIIMGVGGYHKNVIRFQPPLTIERNQLERSIDALQAALREETT